MSTELTHLRNLGVIAHIDAGKTTVTERMLFYSGFSHRVGEVDKGTTVTDFDPEEQERGITIQAACVSFDWEVNELWKNELARPKIQINLIDTPGHVDFTAEVERSLRVLDGGVVVFSAREGVEAQSETVWHQADKYHVPRLAFINKMDREGADFFGTLDEIRTRLDCKPVPINLPIGAGPPHVKEAFRGIIDLIHLKQLTFSKERNGKEITVAEIPDELRDEAELWRGQMLDQLSMFSDELTEMMLGEEPIPPALDPQSHPPRHAAQHDRAGALRFRARRHRRAAGARRGGGLPAQPGRRAAGRRRESEEKRRQGQTQARRPTSRSAGWSSKSRPTATAICTTSAFTRAC